MRSSSGQLKTLCWDTARLYARLARRAVLSRGPGCVPVSLRRCVVLTLFLPVFTVLETLHWVAFWLDDRLFPEYRDTPVEAPVFIVGIPRSGTTHLHRVMARDAQYTTFTTWELLFAPAIIERKVVWAVQHIDRLVGRPLGRCVALLTALCTGSMKDIHRMALDAPEEDFLGLLPVLGCYLLVLVFPGEPQIEALARFDDQIAPERRQRLMAFYKTLLQRHLYAHGDDKTLLSKNVSFTPLLRSLVDTFPDARIVACTRVPEEAVPSQISSMEGAWRLCGLDADSSAFRDRWVQLMRHYYYCIDRARAELDAGHFYLAPMSDTARDLEGTVRTLYQQLSLEMTANFAEALARESDKASGYRSKHHYNLAEYGLDSDQLARDFGAVYRHTYDTEKSAGMESTRSYG